MSSMSLVLDVWKSIRKVKEYIGFLVRVTFTRTYLMSEEGDLTGLLSYWQRGCIVIYAT